MPGAMFSRSSITMTPSRISHSVARSVSLTMRKIERPAGTSSAIGSQAPFRSVTVTASASAAPREAATCEAA